MSAYHAIDALPAPGGSRVALHAAKSPHTVALIVACLLAWRPFLVPSTELGEDALETLLARAGATHVLTVEVEKAKNNGRPARPPSAPRRPHHDQSPPARSS